MPIQVKCSCGRAFSVPDQYAGKVGKCSACGKTVTVPKPAAADEGLLKVDVAPPAAKSGPPCHAHPERLARGACSVCGKLLCQACLCNVEGTHYCQACMVGSGAYRGGPREERGEGLVTKSYKAYFNADTPLAAVRSARLTVMNGWFLWAFMVGMTFFFIYLQPLAQHYSNGERFAIPLYLLQFVAMGFLECAFVACIRDALFQKEFGFARFFHYGMRYFTRYFLCYLAYYGALVFALIAIVTQIATGSKNRTVIVFEIIGAFGALFALTVFFFYSRLLVVLEDASTFTAIRKGISFGLQNWWKVLLLGLFTIAAMLFCFLSMQGGCFVLFLPMWAAPMVRNLFVFLTLGFQIAACMLLYLSLLPDEESFRVVLPPEDIPEPSGPAAVKVSAGVFFSVLALGYWTYHLPSVYPDAFGQTHAMGYTTVINKFGEKIIKAGRPDAALRWKADLDGPVYVTPIAAENDVLVFAMDTAQRRRGSDGSLVWKSQVPGRPAATVVSDGSRAYLSCGRAGPPDDAHRFGTTMQTLVAIDLKDGSIAWRADLPEACETDPSPEVAGDLVLVPSAYQLHAFSRADGKQAWAAGDAARCIFAGPARAADDGIYYATKDMQIHVLNPSDGKELRSLVSPQISVFRKPIVLPDSVWTTATNCVIRLDRTTGALLWEHYACREELGADTRLEVVEGKPVYELGEGLVSLDPAKKDYAWILAPQEGEDGLDSDGVVIKHEQFVLDGFAIAPGGLILLANDAEVIARVDMKEGKRGNMLNLPIEPHKEASSEGEDDGGGEDLQWMDSGRPSEPLLLGDSTVFALRGKLYSVETPKP